MPEYKGKQKVAFEALASMPPEEAVDVITASLWCLLDDADESYLHIDCPIETGGRLTGIVVRDKRDKQTLLNKGDPR